ncbi:MULTISPECIES: pilus assembly FimT family protein [unclassified Schlesneria]|uniref:pilus assembly FimT family protein n=1 Tax=unclassified Schlesneria TaxID=2762017 RepID=UPI002F159722
MMKSTQQHSRRRGHSMMEMVVVMSVLASMAALSWPMLKSPMDKLRLQSAAQEVSAALSKARLKAMQSGEAQVFRFQLHTGKFQVKPMSLDDAQAGGLPDVELSASEASLDGAERSPLNESTDLLLEERELPEGIRFEVAVDTDESLPEIGNTSVESEGIEWIDLAIFYPNGGTTNAVVELRGEPDFRLDVKLSGLTGAAKIGETRRQELR